MVGAVVRWTVRFGGPAVGTDRAGGAEGSPGATSAQGQYS